MLRQSRHQTDCAERPLPDIDARLAAVVAVDPALAQQLGTDLFAPPAWPAETVARGGDLGVLAALAGPAARRRRGVYYTPPALVDHVLAQVPAGATLADLTCGAGAFLLPAAQRGQPVWGQDLDPVAVLAARMRLVSQAECSVPEAITRVRRADAWLTPPPYQPDVIVGNPPWGVMLSAEAREAVARLPLARLVLGRGEVCSAALFLVLASLWVRPGGIVSLVLPETWLGTQRAEPLRRWLCDEIDLLSVDVLRKSVFPAAPDMVPTVVTLRARPAGGSVTVRRYGWRRPLVPDEPLTWSVVGSLARADWRREPLAVPALGSEPELLALWARLAALPGRLADEVEIHDGVYKSRLMPLLAPGAHRVIATAAEVRPGRVAWAGLTTDEVGWDRLRPADRTRAAQPKVLCHALRKPALADRLVAAVDPAGEYVVSNNLVQLIPRAGSRWCLTALANLLNSRLANRWYADRFVQVNIEAFALGALPLPAESGRLGAVDAAHVESEVGRLYGLTATDHDVIERRWQELARARPKAT